VRRFILGSPEKLKAFEIPIAPPAEQHRIVKKIDSLSRRAERAREQLARIPKLIQKYRESG
jgi:restriction endonuclease S subunit